MKGLLVAVVAVVAGASFMVQGNQLKLKGEEEEEIMNPSLDLVTNLLVNHDQLQNAFETWSTRFKKSYETMEQKLEAMTAFKENLQIVASHNSKPDVTYTLEMNHHADLTEKTFAEKYLPKSLLKKANDGESEEEECSATSDPIVQQTRQRLLKLSKSMPKFKDWRQSNIVTPVKNQGHCGSCWTFSTTGALEAHWKKMTKKTLDLSEQQLIDCAQNYDNHGCNGGLPSHAFEYIMENGGIDDETAYPYKAADVGKCSFDSNEVAAKVVGVHNITRGDEIELQAAVAFVGPVSITFQVFGDFRLYKDGVYTSTGCKNGPGDVNHAVLAVGYGHDHEKSDLDYWLVKNSWGPAWGNQGYFKIQRGVNMCGVSMCNSYPLVPGEKDELLKLEQSLRRVENEEKEQEEEPNPVDFEIASA